MKTEIIEYYNILARQYDKDRFSNTYGRYIHQQELAVLNHLLGSKSVFRNLDLACGTGRFMSFAQFGIDISPEMVRVASDKFPSKDIRLGDAEQLSFENESFDNVLSFHLFMHLNFPQMHKIFPEINRVLAKGGLFIFDIPSRKRRKLTGYKAANWHGGNDTDLKSLRKLVHRDWEIISFYGIAFFPIHRIPKRFRKLFIKLDSILCNSIFKEFSSLLIFVLCKK